jgi:pimeloyl-ACP methyl ester carboxylesterase
MQQCVFAMLALGAASVFAVTVEQAESSAQPTKPAEKKTGYAPVNGLKMYYEITGEGKPAVFIHPVVGHCGLVPRLTKNRQWIAMDLQGHGRTADIDRPMTCEAHADDIAALLKHLKIEQADFFGDSFGGTIAVMMAVRHPQLVRRVVSLGGSLAPYPGNASDRPPALC